MMAVCPNCGNQAGEGAVFCDQCGARLPTLEAGLEKAPDTASAVGEAPQAAAPVAASVICSACGAGNVPGEAYCDFCGSPLEQPLPTVETTPAVEPELAVAAPEEAQAPIESAVPAAGGPLTCPACGAEVQPGEAFCADCGASLAQAPIPPEAEPEPVEAEPLVAPLPEEEAELEIVPEAEAEAEPEAVPEVAPATLIVEAEPEPLTCPACGIEVDAGDKFCRNCGAVLEAAPAAPAPPSVTPSPGPRLTVLSSGAEIPLPAQDEIVIGREDPVSGIYPDVDLTPHDGEAGGVSRRHARLIVEGGETFVEDLDSTNHTFVNRQRLVPRARQPLNDGDELRLGRVALRFSE